MRSFPLLALSMLLVACPGRNGGERRLVRDEGPPPSVIVVDAGREGPLTDATLRGEPDADGEVEGDADGGVEAREADVVVDPMTWSGDLSTSMGMPADGRLEGGVPFPRHSPGVRLNPRRLNPGGHYATVETIQAITRAAAVVQRELPSPPGCELTVNDLGFENGGPIPHHGSHQAGRDLDVLFYLLDREGAPRPAKGVPLDPRGRGTDFNDLADPSDDVQVRLDVPRTWRFLQALAEDEESSVQRVFVAEHIRTLLVKHARRAKAPRAARKLVEDLTCQPSTPHDDHLHIRFFCSSEDLGLGCQDMPPLYPWQRQRLASLGVEPVIGRPRPRRRKAKRVSAARARAKAGKMHWKVTAFLELRKSWSDQPHPGRPFCR